jgi:hypothetical protein
VHPHARVRRPCTSSLPPAQAPRLASRASVPAVSRCWQRAEAWRGVATRLCRDYKALETHRKMRVVALVHVMCRRRRRWRKPGGTWCACSRRCRGTCSRRCCRRRGAPTCCTASAPTRRCAADECLGWVGRRRSLAPKLPPVPRRCDPHQCLCTHTHDAQCVEVDRPSALAWEVQCWQQLCSNKRAVAVLKHFRMQRARTDPAGLLPVQRAAWQRPPCASRCYRVFDIAQVAIPGAAVLARQSFSDTPSALEAAVEAGQRFRRGSANASNPAAVAAALQQVRQNPS